MTMAGVLLAGGAVTEDVWRGLSELQRYALIKLTRDKHENANFVPALIEFGAVRRPVLVDA
jgi:hypothetical protein